MMKSFWIAALCLLLLASHQADALPRIVEEVVKNKEFFAEFEGYEDCYLFDVQRLDGANVDETRIGLILLDPQGFEIRLVVKIAKREMEYRDIFVSEKNRREAMMGGSVRVDDAIGFAKSAIENERQLRALD
ncbi:hypothetical protein LJC31_05475 [Synergistaceae bacterium OttesenSCG-928-I11]|nr:hypothetical protein [Synergistaceae bacterium OttesenSCG-928-I11]